MKRNKLPDEPQLHNIWTGGPLLLVALAVVVVIIMFIAWALPEGSNPLFDLRQTTGTAPVSTPLPAIMPGEETQLVEPIAESVGYGDGIIVFSAGLIVLVLIVVLREVLYFRKKESMQVGTKTEDAEEDNHEQTG